MASHGKIELKKRIGAWNHGKYVATNITCCHVLLPIQISGQCDLIPSFYESNFNFLVITYIAGNNDQR